MTIHSITEADIETIANLAGACFIDDSFYISLSTDRNERLTAIQTIFSESIRICIAYGDAYYYKSDGVAVAFALWFNYSKLKKENPTAYNHIFPGISHHSDGYKLHNEYNSIKNLLDFSTEYLYLLAIGVQESHRRQGIATLLVNAEKETYPQYNLFTDVSNPQSVKLYQNLGFDILGEKESCTLIRFLSTQDNYQITKNTQLFLALPEHFPIEQLLGRKVQPFLATLPHIQTMQGQGAAFKQSVTCTSRAKVIALDYDELLTYQRYINVLNYQEIKLNIDKKNILVYVMSANECSQQELSSYIQPTFTNKACEWSLIPDIYISIPIRYRNLNKIIEIHNKQDDFTINRILTSLDFRTIYEAGIPVKELDKQGFKDRIARYYLGKIAVQIQSESEITFNGVNNSVNNIGNPAELGIIISIDHTTQCGVLHLVSLSCGLLLTQLLDSISRNQINIQTATSSENLYSYIKREFDIEKKGTAKSFITVPQKREMIQNDLLASILFCETLYDDDESIGKVADAEILKKLESLTGSAQYNYACVFSYTNVLIQMSDALAGSITERIVKESVTLLYIELILFEEAAIHIANDEIVRFLTCLDKYSPDTVLRNINFIISNHVRTIEFWEIQMNYPSSKKSVNDIRRSFKIKKEQEIVERNKTQLLTIYQIRSGIVDRTEASILSAAGIILTVISVTDLITDSSKSPVLSLIALLIGIVLLTKRFIFQKILTNNKEYK